MAEILNYASDLSDISATLLPYFQSGNINFLIGSGASTPAIKAAGNIEAEISTLLIAGKEDRANLKTLEFIEDIETQNTSIQIHDLIGGDIEEVFQNYKLFLENIDRILFERKTDLLPRQASIFTTNYDTFFEVAAPQIPSLMLNDGFDRTSSVQGDFLFAPELFFDRTYRSGLIYDRQAEIPSINLIKIHGSLTWHKGKEAISYNRKTQEKLTEADKSVADKVRGALDKRALVLPTPAKFSSTLLDRTYYDLLRIFANALERENALLIAFGFSFSDEHIRDITKRALRNPTAQLIIFAYSNEGALRFGSIFAHHRNVKIISPTTDERLNLSCLNAVLEKITPSANAND